jgi:hypothetical protein
VVLVPVIPGGVERIVYALPRGARGLLKQDPYVPALVGGQRSSAELLGNGGKELVGASSRARHVDDDRGERHHSDRSPAQLRGPQERRAARLVAARKREYGE